MIAKILAIFMAISSFFYPACGVVFDVDYEQDLVTYEDSEGNLWSFYGCEDWDAGDMVSCIMFTNGTANIYDDEIVSIRYAGYFGQNSGF